MPLAADSESSSTQLSAALSCPICLEVAQLPVNVTCFNGCKGTQNRGNTCLRGVMCQHCANQAFEFQKPAEKRFVMNKGMVRCLICRETKSNARQLIPSTAYHLNQNVMEVMDILGFGGHCRCCDEKFQSQSELQVHYQRSCPQAVLECKFKGCKHACMRPEMDEHTQVCPVGRDKCPQCSQYFDKDAMLQHMSIMCKNRVVSCVVCKHRARLPDMVKHLSIHQAELELRKPPARLSEPGTPRASLDMGNQEGVRSARNSSSGSANCQHASSHNQSVPVRSHEHGFGRPQGQGPANHRALGTVPNQASSDSRDAVHARYQPDLAPARSQPGLAPARFQPDLALARSQPARSQPGLAPVRFQPDLAGARSQPARSRPDLAHARPHPVSSTSSVPHLGLSSEQLMLSERSTHSWQQKQSPSRNLPSQPAAQLPLPAEQQPTGQPAPVGSHAGNSSASSRSPATKQAPSSPLLPPHSTLPTDRAPCPFPPLPDPPQTNSMEDSLHSADLQLCFAPPDTAQNMLQAAGAMGSPRGEVGRCGGSSTMSSSYGSSSAQGSPTAASSPRTNLTSSVGKSEDSDQRPTTQSNNHPSPNMTSPATGDGGGYPPSIPSAGSYPSTSTSAFSAHTHAYAGGECASSHQVLANNQGGNGAGRNLMQIKEESSLDSSAVGWTPVAASPLTATWSDMDSSSYSPTLGVVNLGLLVARNLEPETSGSSAWDSEKFVHLLHSSSSTGFVSNNQSMQVGSVEGAECDMRGSASELSVPEPHDSAGAAGSGIAAEGVGSVECTEAAKSEPRHVLLVPELHDSAGAAGSGIVAEGVGSIEGAEGAKSEPGHVQSIPELHDSAGAAGSGIVAEGVGSVEGAEGELREPEHVQPRSELHHSAEAAGSGISTEGVMSNEGGGPIEPAGQTEHLTSEGCGDGAYLGLDLAIVGSVYSSGAKDPARADPSTLAAPGDTSTPIVFPGTGLDMAREAGPHEEESPARGFVDGRCKGANDGNPATESSTNNMNSTNNTTSTNSTNSTKNTNSTNNTNSMNSTNNIQQSLGSSLAKSLPCRDHTSTDHGHKQGTGAGEAVLGVNPKFATSDPKFATCDPSSASSDPNYATRDPRSAASDPKFATSDPNYATHDPMSATSDPIFATCDPRSATSDESNSSATDLEQLPRLESLLSDLSAMLDEANASDPSSPSGSSHIAVLMDAIREASALADYLMAATLK
eukprot:gene27611-7248_t